MKQVHGLVGLVITVVALSGFASAQHSAGLYLPDGTELEWPEVTNLATVLSTHFPGVLSRGHYVPDQEDDPVAIVYFELFSDRPMFVYTRHPERVTQYIASYDHRAYLTSWQFPFDLRSEGLLNGVTDLYFFEAIGAPDSRVARSTAGGQYEIWRYSQYRVSLEFRDGRLVAFTEP